MSATDIVTWGRTTGGKPARMGRRTAAHVDYTIARLKKAHPGAVLHVIQSAYNTGVAASAGTHDKDGCLDVWIEGLDWWAAQKFLRQCGWAAWFRFPPAFGNHIHMISLGCPGPVGIFVPGQIGDYYDHRTGLKGHAADNSWHPADIDATIFDFAAWEQENDMTPDQDKLLKQIAKDAAAAKRLAGQALERGKVNSRAIVASRGNDDAGFRSVLVEIQKLDDSESA